MKIFSKYLGMFLTLYLFIIVVDTIWELFGMSAKKSSSIITFLGISISNIRTAHNLSTTFGLTYKFFIGIGIVLLISIIIAIVKKKSK